MNKQEWEKYLWSICNQNCGHNTMIPEGSHVESCKAYYEIKKRLAVDKV